jgi:hypothetical protein
MTVYIVWFINFQSERELCGIYGTREKAQGYIDNSSDGDQMEIEEDEVQ